jgi:hypothetical protein
VAYWVFTSVGASLLLIPVPFIVNNAGKDWRVSYWFWAGLAAFSLILIVFCVPETLFSRQAAQLSGTVHVTDSYGTYRSFAYYRRALKYHANKMLFIFSSYTM